MKTQIARILSLLLSLCLLMGNLALVSCSTPDGEDRIFHPRASVTRIAPAFAGNTPYASDCKDAERRLDGSEI